MNQNKFEPEQPQTAGSKPAGCLYLVGTPIGNLQDLSHRASQVLAEADLIAAEDTRRTRQLLHHLGLHKKMTSYHEHNRQSKAPQLLRRLIAGQSIALVSDAGMPAISDPGSELVSLCAENEIRVQVIPGPCAAITALAGSGQDTDRFCFEGFLPAVGKNRKQRLDELKTEKRTMVLYEAPHRLKRTLDDLAGLGFQNRRLTLACELTKKFESFHYLTVVQACDYFMETAARGEYVLVLEGETAYSKRHPAADDPQAEAVRLEQAVAAVSRLLAEGLPLKDAARQVAGQTGLRRNTLYQAVIETERQKSADDQD